MGREAQRLALRAVEPRAGQRKELGEPSAQPGQVAPAADVGKMPIVVSGMASTVRSVATRKRHGQAMPTPPPMVMPSMKATPGLG